jgi:hypothetical protein
MLETKFVKYIPDEIKEDVLYISYEFNTAIHLCACGCKNKVVTPISPIQWCYTYNGESINLSPSIGNWNFDCKSHYWIKKSKVIWADKWDKQTIKVVQSNEQMEINEFYDVKKTNQNWLNKFTSFFKNKK